MRVLLAVNHPEIEALIAKLETEKGIRELGSSLQREDLCQWAKPLIIIDQALYRERLLEKAKAAKPDVIILYDKLPGTIELEVLLEELRLEIKNRNGQDARIIFLTSLEQGAGLLRKAVEIGVWDIISGQDIYPAELITRLYHPANYSEAAHFRLAGEEKGTIKLIPRYIETEKIVKIPEIQQIEVTKVVEKTEYLRVGNLKGNKETVVLWSPYQAGKTFLAVNMAVALAQMGLRTTLVDADLENRALENHFLVNNDERYTLVKILQMPSGSANLMKRCYLYKKGLRVLSLPEGRGEVPDVVEENFYNIYDVIRQESDIILIDGAARPDSPLTAAALKIASRVLLVMTQDPLRAKNLRVILNNIAALGISLTKFEPVLNMHIQCTSPTKQDLSKILHMDILPWSVPAIPEAAYKSIAEGVPAYDAGNVPEHFIDAVNSLANHLNEGDLLGRKLQYTKRNFWGFFR